jgi:hypothetical protein
MPSIYLSNLIYLSAMLGIELKSLLMLGKYFTTELYPPSSYTGPFMVRNPRVAQFKQEGSPWHHSVPRFLGDLGISYVFGPFFSGLNHAGQ